MIQFEPILLIVSCSFGNIVTLTILPNHLYMRNIANGGLPLYATICTFEKYSLNSELALDNSIQIFHDVAMSIGQHSNIPNPPPAPKKPKKKKNL